MHVHILVKIGWKVIYIILFNRVSEASSRPRTERRSVKNHHDEHDSDEEETGSSYSFSPTPDPIPSAPPQESSNSDSYFSGPFKALYDFESGKERRNEKHHLSTTTISLTF